MSTTALGVVSASVPEVPAPYVVAHPGTSPTITVPACDGRRPDLHGCWVHLAATAAFFGTPMPSVDELERAYAAFVAQRTAVSALDAITVTVVDLHDGPRAVIAGASAPGLGAPVRIDVCDQASPLARSGDPEWRRMAGRTTSRGEADQLRRWLDGRGFADGVPPGFGPPFLGSLVFSCGDDVGGIDEPEPTSLLDQLRRCGAIAGVGSFDGRPGGADRAWWISPEYGIHPVAELGPVSYTVTTDAPPTWWRVG